MHMDPMMPYLVGATAVILLLGLVLRRLGQPPIVAYLIAGLVLGPSGLGVIADRVLVARVGDVGVILLLFFVGMEISLPALLSNWRVPVLGTALQVAASVASVLGIGAWQAWPWRRSVLLGFVISLSSTAVVVKLLQQQNETETPTGRDVVGVLLAQDLGVIAMLVVIGLMAGRTPSAGLAAVQAIGGAALIGLLLYVARNPGVKLPFTSWLRAEPELEVFAAFLLCAVFALVTGLIGLSAALGAFVAGIVLGAAGETKWVHESLWPFHVLLVALFFVSVGMAIDLRFVAANWRLIALLVVAVVLTNTGLNAAILRVLGRPWRKALYGGALLSQIGEFSFVLAAVGRESNLIEAFGYQATVGVIATTLLLSPLWVALARRATRGG